MVDLFKCDKCHRTFNRKQDLNRHLNRIVDCVNGSKTNKKNISYVCKFCKKKFSRKDNMERHVKSCKQKIINTTINKGNDIAINNAKNEIALNKSNIYLTLVLFTKDGIKNLTQEELTDLFGSKRNMIEEMISTVNFNPNKPQHHNVYYPDMKSTYGIVYENKKWVTKKIDEILNLLLDAKLEDLNEILNEMGDFLNKKTRNKIKETIENADYSKPNYRKKLISYLKPILYNNKEMIIKTRKMIESANEIIKNTKKKKKNETT